VMIGWSLGCIGVREMWREGVRPCVLMGLDGTSGDWPGPTDAQLDPWREACAEASERRRLVVLTATQQTYVEGLDLVRDGHAPFAATERVVSQLFLPYSPVALAPPLPPGRYDAGELHVEVHASNRVDGPAHEREVRLHGPRLFRDLVVPFVEGLESGPATPRDTSIPPPAPATLRSALVELVEADLVRGIAEIGGQNRGPDVEMFLRSVGLPPGQPWCAAYVSERGKRAAQRARVKWPLMNSGAVRHLVESAIPEGRWCPKASGYTPVDGDLVVYGRGGQRPDRKGLGHVGVYLGGKVASGNDGDALRLGPLERGAGQPLCGFVDLG
jgi:hypothetical protein